MNFTISDGDYTYLEKTPEFVEEYNKGQLNTNGIIEKLNITRGEYRKLRKHAIEENLLQLKRKPNRKKKETYKTNPKHYGKQLVKGIPYWRVYKNTTYYCTVKKEKHAKEIVKRLEKCNWDKNQVNKIKQEVISEK